MYSGLRECELTEKCRESNGQSQKTHKTCIFYLKIQKYVGRGHPFPGRGHPCPGTPLPKRIQESLANAKVSARQPWYIGRNSINRPLLRNSQQYQRNLYIVEKYFQCSTILSLTIRVYLHSFSRCCLPNMPTSAKFRENFNL